jgi:hypothetical protein
VPLVSEQPLEGVLEVPLTEIDLGLGPLSAKGRLADGDATRIRPGPALRQRAKERLPAHSRAVGERLHPPHPRAARDPAHLIEDTEGDRRVPGLARVAHAEAQVVDDEALPCSVRLGGDDARTRPARTARPSRPRVGCGAFRAGCAIAATTAHRPSGTSPCDLSCVLALTGLRSGGPRIASALGPVCEPS